MVACDITDVACQFQAGIVGLIMPILLPIILFLVLVFVVPKAGWRGVIIAIIGIFLMLWYYGLLPFMPKVF